MTDKNNVIISFDLYNLRKLLITFFQACNLNHGLITEVKFWNEYCIFPVLFNGYQSDTSVLWGYIVNTWSYIVDKCDDDKRNAGPTNIMKNSN